MLEDKGLKLGKALLYRHNLIEDFLKLLNITEGILAETEKMEHTINDEILTGIKDLVDFFNDNPELLEKLNKYRNQKKK